jgi:PGF-pre-PGF domain-containing protein
MINKTVLLTTLILSLLLVFILSGNASAANNALDYTLVVIPPQNDEIQQSSSGSSSVDDYMDTPEIFTNIEKAESFDRNLIANTPVTYTYKIPELGIYEIAVTGKENENNIALRVEVLKGTSKLVTISAPGIVYKNVNIQAGSKQIKEFLIKFKVENSWITDNNLAGSDVRMVKWDGGKWMQIETSEKSKDNTYTFYEVKTDALFVFAITGLKNEVAPKATQAIEITKTPSRPTGQATSGIPIKTENVRGFEIILAIATILAVYRAFRKKR